MYHQWTPTMSKRKRMELEQRAKRRWMQLMSALTLFIFAFGDVNSVYVPENLRSGFVLLGQSFSEVFLREVKVIGGYFAGEEEGEREGVEEYVPVVKFDYEETYDFFSVPVIGRSGGIWSDVMEEEGDFLLERGEEGDGERDFLKKSEEEGEWKEDVGMVSGEECLEEDLPLAVGTILGGVDLLGEGYEGSHVMEHIYLGERAMISPLVDVITSGFGERVDPISGEVAVHSGVDVRGEEGTEIMSWSDGVVENVGETWIVGRYLRIDHGDDIVTFYAHCSDIVVKEGQEVSAGEVVALVGATGEVTGSHLHFEIRYKEFYLNPLYYMNYLEILA